MAKRLEGEARQDYLRKLDRRLSRFFLVLLALNGIIVAIVAVASQDLFAAGVVFAALIMGTFFLVGLVAWVRMGDHGIISTIKMFQFFLLISIIGAIIFALVSYYSESGPIFIGFPGAGGEFEPYQNAYAAAIVLVAMSLSLWGVQLAVICIAFGTIWFAGLAIRRLMPGILKGVRQATFTRSDGVDTKLMLWLMDIPDMLDLSKLKVEAEPPNARFPRDRFFRAVFWEIFLGTIMAIYVSLNPLLLESLDIVQVFSVLGSISMIIPIIIIPWFSLLALKARIPGITKEFELFRGIRSRILQTFVALGTIVVFIRLALREHDPGTIFGSFASYYLLLGLFSLYFAFVYFNFFEGDLAKETERRYQRL
ncbi:MAG: hypothetical protein LUQ16_07850 [Methanomassiliicoccales archaeon]|nr:hypothetical protein [Methanomassiliicoccales archaeon]MDD1756338.1 hypothetical protein [Methanomassiliicoccales archaeon]